MIWWICTGLAIAGSLFVAQRRIEGFYFWIVADVGFVVKNASAGDWSQVFLWVVYAVIAVNGVRVWWRKEREES